MTRENRPGVPTSVHAGLLFVQLTFGGFHVIAKAVIANLHPLALAGTRVLVATPLLLLLAWRHDHILPRRRDLPWLALLGLLGVFANQVLFILGLRWTTATNAALLMPSIPVFAAAVAVVAGVERASWRRMAGIGLAVAGALVMLDPTRFQVADRLLAGNLLILVNCLSYAAFLVVIRVVVRRLPVVTTIAWSFLFGGIGVIGVSWPYLRAVNPSALSTGIWLGVAYIVLVPTTLNYLINTWAVARSTPSLVAVYTTVQPLAAGLLAAQFLHERPAATQLAGGLLIAAGLWWVAASQPARAPDGDTMT